MRDVGSLLEEEAAALYIYEEPLLETEEPNMSPPVWIYFILYDVFRKGSERKEKSEFKDNKSH